MLLALLAVATFDLGTEVPISYEAFARWSAQGVASGRGLHLWPLVAPWGLPQVYLGALTAALHLDPRIMRLTVLPFLAAAAWGEFLLARRLGAARSWSAAMAMVLACSPLTLGLATGFQSDVPYLGLLLPATALGLAWVVSGRGAAVTVVLVLLALLQRQFGIGVLAGVTVGLVLVRRDRAVGAMEWAMLAAGWLVASGIEAAAFPLGLATADSRHYGAALLSPPVPGLVAGVFEVPVMVAFVGIPVLLPLLASRARRVGRRQLAAFGLALYALAMSAVVLAGSLGVSRGRSILPGDWFGESGIGPAHLPGAKPALFTGPEFIAIEVVTLALVVLVFAWRADIWTLNRGNLVRGAYLGVVAASQFPAVYMDAMIDRHFLPDVALALAVVAVALSRSGFRWPGALPALRATMVAAAILEIGIFAAGEQDLQAWLSASRTAADLELASTPPNRVDAGMLNAELVDIPYFDRTGRLPDYPRPVEVYLAFAGPDDPRPGVAYRSRAPGKIVIACTELRKPCPFAP